MNLWNCLEHAAALHPERPAVAHGTGRRSWLDVRMRALRLAERLSDLEVSPGARVAVLEWNTPEFLELTFAVARLGAVLMPVNVRLDPRQARAVLDRGGARLLVAHPDFAPLVRAALEGTKVERVLWTTGSAVPVDGVSTVAWPSQGGGEVPLPSPCAGPWDRELAQLYFTSGTTGEPKGVMLTHANIGEHAQAAIDELAIDERDVWAHVAPMFHLADAWATVAVTLAGGCHVFVPRFDAGSVAQAIDEHGVTLTNLIPTMLAALTQEVRRAGSTFGGSSLRMLLSGGAPIAPEVVRRVLETFGCEYVQTYGMTETSPYLTLSLLGEALRREPAEVQLRYRAKTGRAFRGVELRLVDDGGADVPADGASVGEILARGPTVTPGYWKDPEATRAAFVGDWLRTGDLATCDERGYFDIVDRKKDIIITGGENVYSTEVENVLYEHPAVLEAAVVGRPDERWGERVHAVVVLGADREASPEELLTHCRERLPGFKAPKTLELRNELPKTGSGKIHKRALR